MSSESGKKTSLTQALNTTATTIYLASPPTTYPGRGFMENGNIKEWVSYTGVTSTSITGVVRGLSQTADPITGGTGLSWNAGTSFRVVFMHDQLPDKTRPFPIYSGTTAVLAALTGIVTYSIAYDTTLGQYVYYNGSAWTSFATGTVADASTTVAGKVEIATTAQTVAGTDTGETSAKLIALPSDIAKNQQSATFIGGADVGGDDTYVVALVPALASYTTRQKLRATLTTANTGACTIDFGPGVKNIKLIDGTDPLDGDIAAGGTYDFIYDGTNMVLQSVAVRATTSDVSTGTNTVKFVTPAQLRSQIPVPKNGTDATRAGDAVSGTQNIAHGLGKVPSFVTIDCVHGTGGVSALVKSSGCYNGTTNSSVANYAITVAPEVDNTNGVNMRYDASNSQRAVITVDATNIILTWTKQGNGMNGSTNPLNILWTAY